MDDTPIDVYRMQVAIWRKKTFEERMRIGCQWDDFGLDAARALVQRNSPDPAALFLALHGASFPVEVRERIAAAIRQWATTQPEPAAG